MNPVKAKKYFKRKIRYNWGYVKKTIAFFFMSVVMFIITLDLWFICVYRFKISSPNYIFTVIFDLIVILASMFISDEISDIAYALDLQIQKTRRFIIMAIISVFTVICFIWEIYRQNFSSFEASLLVTVVSYILIDIFNIISMWICFLPPVVIDIKNQENVYLDSTGQICIEKDKKNNNFSFSIQRLKDDKYEFDFVGLFEWSQVRKWNRKIKDYDLPSHTFQKDFGEIITKPIDDYLNKKQTFLGISNQYCIVVDYFNEKDGKKHRLIESVLFLNSTPQEDSDHLNRKKVGFNKKKITISDYNWIIQDILTPAFLSVGFSLFVTAMYLITNKWLDSKLFCKSNLQYFKNIIDVDQLNAGYWYVVAGFVFIYFAFLLRYILQMNKIKDKIFREKKFHEYVVIILDGSLLILPLLTVNISEIWRLGFSFYTTSIIFIIGVWLFFNLIKLITIIYKWIVPEFSDKGDEEKFPRSNFLLNIISLIVGWFLGRR